MEDVAMSHWSPSDSEEELPLDLNPNMSARSAIIDVLFHRRSLRSKKPNYRDARLASAPLANVYALHQSGISRTLPEDYIPPRPKPPIPAQFFIHLPDKWPSMPKEVVRNHLVECFAVRDKYLDAYQTWEDGHNKWTRRVYRLMRVLMKAQRRVAAEKASGRMDLDSSGEAEADEDDIETVLDALAEEDASQAATEFDSTDFEVLDQDGSALTYLEEGAEADEEERIRRWFMSRFKRAQKAGTPSPISLPALRRAGPVGTFGLSHEGKASRIRKTPSFDLPRQAARNVPAHRIQDATPPAGLGIHMDINPVGNNSASDGEEEDGDSHPWRIYSTKCSCGCADCYCHSWRSWWDQTHEMLAYVEYVDLPVVPDPEDPPSSSARFVRLYPGMGPSCGELNPQRDASDAENDPQARSKDVNDFLQTKEQIKPRCAQNEVLDPRYFTQVLVQKPKPPCSLQKSSATRAKGESNGSNLGNAPNKSKDNDTPSRSNYDLNKNPSPLVSRADEPTRSSQRAPLHDPSFQPGPYPAFKLQWEDFIEKDPTIPSEYSQKIFRVLIDELEPACMPDWASSGSNIDWRTRNRFVNWISYAHYCCNSPPQVLFLSVNLMDRFLVKQSSPLHEKDWNVLAAACLWTSWKFEEASHRPVDVDSVITWADPDMVCKKDVILAEWNLHQELDHNLSYPGPLVFMRRAIMIFGYTDEIVSLAAFFAEISLTLESMVLCRPSGTAAAAVWLARELLGTPTSAPKLEHATFWKAHELYLPLTYIISAILKMPRVQSGWDECTIFRKWADPYLNVAHWCQDVLQYVWSNPREVHFERDLPRLRRLVRSGKIPPLQKINPGPP